tara:strand:- start:2040 stop:2837 length:798 start_codon:yes stop_codon:yes gene_type:complete
MANRNAQGYFLGSNYAVGVAANGNQILTGTAQVPLLMEQLVLDSTADDGIITAIRLAGQNLFASNSSVPYKLFKSYSFAHKDSSSSLSVPIDRNQTFQVSLTNGAAVADYVMAVGTTPLINPDGSEVATTPDVNQLGSLLNYVFGFGGYQAVGAGATVTFTATALRNCTLGKLIICNDQAAAFGALADITIDSVQVNNIELLSSAAGEVIPAETLGVLSQIDLDDALIAYNVELNSTVSITVTNRNAGVGQNISMAAFCLPSFNE